jgi:hypothetical protein
MSQLVAFDSGHLLERGTDVALYDYARCNEELLGNRSLILCPAQADRRALQRFCERFSVCLYRSRRDLEWLLRGVDLYYVQDHGDEPPGGRARPPHGRLAVHCVFEARQPHGDVYAAISDWVAEHRGAPGTPVVPYMVQVPDLDGDLRDELGVPRDATVLGRHGGFETFDIPFVHAAVRAAALERGDLWFLFLNTRRFADHPRIVHLPACIEPERKVAFVNSCDAMLHARAEGETFGLAVAEFSARNKPVITWLGSPDRAHIEVLGTKGLYYRDAGSLLRILRAFRPVQGDFDAFSRRFAPAVVMQSFARVFGVQAAAPAATTVKGRGPALVH